MAFIKSCIWASLCFWKRNLEGFAAVACMDLQGKGVHPVVFEEAVLRQV
jgi:hypothetical protein